MSVEISKPMPQTLGYGKPPASRWPSVILWVGSVLAFGVIALGVFSYLTTRDTGVAVPTPSESILRRGPLWFMYPYSGLLIGSGIGEQGLLFVFLEVFFLYPLYAVFFGIVAYRGGPWRLLVILIIVHLILGAIGVWSFVCADAEFHRRRALQPTGPRDSPTLHWTGPAERSS